MKRIKALTVLAGTLASLVATLVVPAPSGARPATAAVRYCPQAFVAHRGEDWPKPDTQDGSKAIQAAIDDPSAFGVESDVWRTKDGKGLMQHDDDLAISTDGHGLVSSYTLAYEQAHFRMDDGTKPQSVLGYLRQVVAAKQHAVLHVKSTGVAFDTYISRQLTAAHAHQYVRPMATTLAQARFFVGHGWITELTVHGAATSSTAKKARATGVAAVLVVDATSKTRTPSTWIRPYIDAGIATDYVSYNAVQDRVINRYPFSRVLSGDIEKSEAISHCTTKAK